MASNFVNPNQLGGYPAGLLIGPDGTPFCKYGNGNASEDYVRPALDAMTPDQHARYGRMVVDAYVDEAAAHLFSTLLGKVLANRGSDTGAYDAILARHRDLDERAAPGPLRLGRYPIVLPGIWRRPVKPTARSPKG